MLRNLKEFKLPEIEEKVLKFWKENKIFERTQVKKAGQKAFRFFEGPPTANGQPHMGHAQGRVFKDIIPRFKTMQGFFVRRKAGWDTHGLPVEIEVEKELGLKNKQDIEKFGIAEFNEKAKASVWKYQEEWERMTDRIGFWVDLKNPYITYKPEYIESLWWVFKEIAKKNLLTQSFKIVPYCPRCQTPLSSHEVSQGYKKISDPSIFVKFRVRRQVSGVKNNEFLLVWTTTPWTLPSNVAVAVNPELTYTKYRIGKEYAWSYSMPPFDAAQGDHLEVIEKISGKKLIGLQYEPLFKVKGPWLKNKNFFKVYPADFVSTEDGTGLVHIAPAFGEDDMNLIKKYQKDLIGEIPITIDEKGLVVKGLPGAGKFAKQVDKEIIKNLDKRKLLLKSGVVEHDYPFCWRCDTPLLYFARHSWFIEISKLQNELLKNNEKINWIPGHIKEGRFGEWLKEIKDWAISRDRYWGTPLPIWVCEGHNEKAHMKKGCGHTEVIGSLEDLDKLRFSKNNFFLLRHGESDHNLTGLIAAGSERGKNISRLTQRGKEQIKKAAEKLAKELKKGKLDLIFTSPYLRTKETAKIASKIAGGKIIVDKRLSELDCGLFNWRKVEDHRNFFANDLERFTKLVPGGENLNQVKKRMLGAVSDINSKYSDKNILVISHGDPFLALEGALKGLPNEEILNLDYVKVDGPAKNVEIHNWPYNADGEVDLHRPYVDNIFLRCRKCGEKMIRVKEVADVWFDSGAMPFAQFHYPFNCAQNQKSKIKNQNLGKELKECVDYPADYISEGIDMTRGWFYTLLAVSTALGLDLPPYLNVIVQGHILDKFGKKMSKSKGNVVSPWEMINKYGADTLRWYFYTQTVPGEPKAFDELDLGKTLRKFIMIIYNSFVFFDTYGKQVTSDKRQATSKNVLDRWILARLHQTIQQVTDGLEKYDIGNAGKSLEVLADDLSRWYIRRSRNRFQHPDDESDFKQASQTLHYCLLELSKLLAPFTPFFAEGLYQSLRGTTQTERGTTQKTSLRKSASSQRESAVRSVHLTEWSEANKKTINYPLLEKMEEVRRISSLALALRAEKGIKVRQPLQVLEVRSKKLEVRDIDFIEILKDEVNVKEVKWNQGLKGEVDLDTRITPELKEEGLVRELVRMVQGLRHDASYVPKDKIVLMVEAPKELVGVWKRKEADIKKEVGAKEIEFKKSNKFDAEIDSEIDGQKMWIAVRKLF